MFDFDLIFSAFMDAVSLHIKKIHDKDASKTERKIAYRKLKHYHDSMMEETGQVLCDEQELNACKKICDTL